MENTYREGNLIRKGYKACFIEGLRLTICLLVLMFYLSQLRNLRHSPLVKNSIVYVASDGLSRAIPFLLLPIISRYLTPSDYGIVTNYNVLVAILGAFMCYCSAGVIPVMFFKLEKSEMAVYTSNMMIFNGIMTLICTMLIICFSNTLSNSLNLSLPFLFSAIALTWFTSFTNAVTLIWRCEEKPISFGIFNVSYSFINALTTVLFIVVMLMGWKGRIYSQFMATVMMGLIGIYILKKKRFLVWKVSKEYIKNVALFSFPIIPHAVALWAKSGADKVMLTNLCSLTENGLYSVAMTWGGIFAMILTAYSNSYAPYLYKKLSAIDKDRDGTISEQQKIVKMIGLSILMIFVIAFCVQVISHILIGIIYPENYEGSRSYLPWVMISQAFMGCYSLFVCFSHYTFNTKILGTITFSICILQTGITYFFILWFGSLGAAYTSALGSFAMFICVALYGMHVYKLPWNYKFKTT